MSYTLEVYLDSYSNEPIVEEMDETISINVGDEISRDDWLRLLDVPNARLELKVKVEDVRHQFWDTAPLFHSLSIKVVPIE